VLIGSFYKIINALYSRSIVITTIRLSLSPSSEALAKDEIVKATYEN